MRKYLTIFATLIALGTGSANAQQVETTVQKMVVPGADFDIIIVLAKPNGATFNPRGKPDPFVVYPTGDALAFAVDGEVEKMFAGVGSVQFPIVAFQVDRKGSKAGVYVVPKINTSTAKTN